MKEAPNSPYKGLIFRETFRSEQEVRRNSGEPTDVDFSNGVASFNGSSSYILTNIYPSTTNRTLRYRVKFKEPIDNNWQIIGVNDDEDRRTYLGIGDSSEDYKIRVGINDNYDIGVGISVELNKWTTLTLVAKDGTYYLYQDSVLTGSGAYSEKNEVSNEPFYIGKNNADTDSWVNGEIDFIEIYNRALTPSEVANLYNNTWNKEVQDKLPRGNMYACDLNVEGWQRCADDNGSNSGGTYGAGKSLKAVGQGNGTDDVGFSGKLAGFRYANGSYGNLGSNLHLWSSTPSSSTNAFRRTLLPSYSTVGRSSRFRGYGFSVRCLRDTDDTSDFTDPRDGETYSCVKIGNQVWMTENLRYLPEVTPTAEWNSETEPQYAVYDYTGTDVAEAKATSNYQDYGVLYNWPGAMVSAPEGFHVPSDEEINILEKYVVGKIKEWYPDKTLLDFNSTNGLVELGDRADDATITDVTVKKQGAEFNGSTSKIDTGTDFIGTKAVTVMGWIKPYNYGERGIGRFLNNNKFNLITQQSNSSLTITSNGSSYALSDSNSILLNKWHFISVTRESDGTVNFYIGDKSTAPALSGTANQDSGTPEAGTTNVIIGNNDAQSRTFDGLISKLKVVEGILSLQDISRYWSSTRGDLL